VKAKAKQTRIHKLLLLGTGNSGKSTFFKQLTQIHGGGFAAEEYLSSTKHIRDAVITQMKHLLNTFKDAETDEFKAELDDELVDAAKKICALHPEHPLADVAEDIKMLWDHPTIRTAYDQRDNLGISDSAPHFFDDIDRLVAPNYQPTDDDILLARIPTTGIQEKRFIIMGSHFSVFDVGGQRSERNKWIHCFESVQGIIFVASLACYDQMLYEDNELNAMYEALELFNIVVNSRYFARASMILFMNKSDLFRLKIATKPLTICFPEYDGRGSIADTAEYITNQFKKEYVPSAAKGRDNKQIYTHLTCAIDRGNVKKIFDDVQHCVVTNALKYNGLI
jgi:GTPase SAR1 family protein